jgi:hypothetical protein
LPHHSGGGGPAIQTIQTFWANLPNLILAKPYYENMSKILELFFIKDITMVCQKSLEYITKPYICQTIKPEDKVCMLPIAVIVL